MPRVFVNAQVVSSIRSNEITSGRLFCLLAGCKDDVLFCDLLGAHARFRTVLFVGENDGLYVGGQVAFCDSDKACYLNSVL